eukprot:symbB.v1.2.016726.t2/scaffold1271.1/size203481/16
MRATLHHLNKLASRSQHAEDREVSYAMRLLQRASVSHDLEEEERNTSMPAEEFERCKNLAWEQNMSEGVRDPGEAGALTTMNCCWAFLRLIEFLRDLITRQTIVKAQEEVVRFRLRWRLIEFLFLLGVLFPLIRNIKEPRTAWWDGSFNQLCWL